MKVTVKQIFIDKNNPGKKYFPGDVVEFDNARATELYEKGIVEIESKPISKKEEVVVASEEKKVKKSPEHVEEAE